MARARYLVVVALVGIALPSAGCSSGTALDLTLHLEGVDPTSSGGYWIDLREPDGSPIDGITEQFVPWRSGAQTVRLSLTDDRYFTVGPARNVRVVVWVHPAQDQAPVGHGTELATLELYRSVTAEVVLRPDPRPVAEATTTARVQSEWQLNPLPNVVDSPGRTLRIATPPDLPPDWHWHAWFIRPNGEDGDERRWLGLLAGDAIEAVIEGDPLLSRDFHVEITAEAQPEPLALPLGWRVADGRLGEGYRGALGFIVEDGREITLWMLLDLLRQIASHAGLSADSLQAAGRRNHAEHTFFGLVGEGAETDLSGSGSPQDPIGDPLGVVPPPEDHQPEPPPRPRYFELLHGIADGVVDQNPEDGAAGDARRQALVQAERCMLDVLDELAHVAFLARSVAVDPDPSDASVEALREAAHAVFGRPWAGEPGDDDLALCFIERIEALSTFNVLSLQPR